MKILLADDHPMIRTAIEALLRDTVYELVGASGSGEETLHLVERLVPDILLLDLQMPKGTGLDVIRDLRASDNAICIIIMTAAIDDSSLMEARALGVRGFVLKNSDPAYLLECLGQVCRGETWLDPELSNRFDALSESFSEKRRPTLAPRERALIGFIRLGLRNRQVAEELGVTEGTVKVYLHGIFEKLGVSSRTELAVRADEFLAEKFSRK